MIKSISEPAESDPRLASLLDEAWEYAAVYLMAKKRQKGCDGMGELVTLREEFRDIVDKVIQYCKEKKYISEVIGYDIDGIADEIRKVVRNDAAA